MSAEFESSKPPCVLHEDEHLLVVNKPAGMNTHAPSPLAGEGIYDWLKHREPRWANLAILHRLDKETSGVMVFGKTTLANRTLTEQFTRRAVRKKYLLLSDRAPKRTELVAKSRIVRAGDRYVSGPSGEIAETRFRPGNQQSAVGNRQCIFAEPLTGRTHQIRVHAAENGFPILGDVLYGGSPFHRVCLHAAEISFQHPATGQSVRFCADADFAAEARIALRSALIDPFETNAFRLIHGAGDGWPGWYVEQLGDYLLSQSERDLSGEQTNYLKSLLNVRRPRENVPATPSAILPMSLAGVYHKALNRNVRRSTALESSPRPVLGGTAPERFSIRENALNFELSFSEGYSVGLFLDQRDNRRRFLTGHIAADFFLPNLRFPRADLASPASDSPSAKFELLNCFAYTCGFSVCAAKSGAAVTSLDLSKKYLEWGRRNFVLNSLDPAKHDFIYGDVFDWLRRFTKKGRQFDAIVLDPPTFSQSREHGVFRAEKEVGALVTAALPVLKPDGVLLASSNAANWSPEDFVSSINAAIHSAQRKVLRRHYVPQPPDFPITKREPAYLKTLWLQISGG